MVKITSSCLVVVGLLVGLNSALYAADGNVAYLNQGWDKNLREKFYFTPQGSRLMPVKWFLAVEKEDGTKFAASENLKRYGFLVSDQPSELNPYNLPIGFAIDPKSIPGRGLSLGLTCSACHTGDVTVEGKKIRIDGAPANLDFDRFLSGVADATRHTYFDEEAFARFARQVLPAPAPLTIAQLRLDLADFQSALEGDAVIRKPVRKSGFGRVDALTQIVNSLAVSAQQEPRNLVPVGAPTSYPFLWLTPQLEFVQWNPIAASPIARNAGEVLGVFGDLNRA